MVVDKKFEAAHWEGGWEHYYVPQYSCRSEYDYSLKSYRQVCGVQNQQHSRWEDHHTWHDNAWKLQLEDCKRNDKDEMKCRKGWVRVDETTYHQTEMSDRYP